MDMYDVTCDIRLIDSYSSFQDLYTLILCCIAEHSPRHKAIPARRAQSFQYTSQARLFVLQNFWELPVLSKGALPSTLRWIIWAHLGHLGHLGHLPSVCVSNLWKSTDFGQNAFELNFQGSQRSQWSSLSRPGKPLKCLPKSNRLNRKPTKQRNTAVAWSPSWCKLMPAWPGHRKEADAAPGHTVHSAHLRSSSETGFA